jgi:hypothetical protein
MSYFDMSRNRSRLKRAALALVAAMLSTMVAPLASAGVSFQTFPYRQNFDTLTTVTGLAWMDGGSATLLTQGCFSGQCMKIVPPATEQVDAGIGDFNFPARRTIWVRYLIKFGPDFAQGLIQRMKHVIAHRLGDESHDRGMLYIWHIDGQQDFAIGACENNDCDYQAGGGRPDGTEDLQIAEALNEWIAIEAAFDSATHTIRVYASTQDGRLNEQLIAQRAFHSIEASQDMWNRISMIGSYLDFGTRPSSGMWWMVDDLVISDQKIGLPANFLGSASARPMPPSNVRAQ